MATEETPESEKSEIKYCDIIVKSYLIGYSYCNNIDFHFEP